ncbi:MAG TPA: glycosyltransferase family 4 protein [Povalibacter sp.]|uniref:glycosyltransferase family 4 protein n=1 Tax=Povalibacter sp. TaxID=1962978 RepID=UPI002B907703|nr:glycosyltransferase family 4 protein [Povalibacter sp.]HMN42971.1 glycosyltransferase family 4 protein [Povalibacter sp.]
MTTAVAARKLTVLLVVRWPVGGIRSYLRYTYGLMPRSDLDLVLCGPRSEDLDECVKALAAFEPKVYRAASAGIRDIFKAARQALKENHVDVMHSQGYSSAVSVAPLVVLGRKPHVVTIHDMFTEALRKQWSIKIGRWVLAGALGVSDVVQPTGRAVETNFRRHMSFWPATRPTVETIRNGIDPQRFCAPARRDLRSELQLAAQDFVIGFMGRFMAIKGFHVLIKAMQELVGTLAPPRRPIVVAIGSGGFVREDRAAIERSALGDHFRFLPHTNEVGATLRGLDVLVIPSMSEASPILPMEALICGVPVIASACDGLVDVLQGTPASLFPIGNGHELALNLRARMDAPGRQEAEAYAPAARDRFDARNSAASLEAVLRRFSRRTPA